MKDAVIEYEILNWEKYNPPKEGQRQHTWFRTDADMPISPDISRLDDKVFRVWFTLLARACKGRGKGRVSLMSLCSMVHTKVIKASSCLKKLQDAGMIKHRITGHNIDNIENLPLRTYERTNSEEKNQKINSLTTSLEPENLETVEVEENQRVSEGDERVSKLRFSEDEWQVIGYAEQKFNRVIGDTEAENFATEWRTKPKLTAEFLRKAIDWLAGHPIARVETASIVRAFHVQQVRKQHFEFDKRNLTAVQQLLGQGMAPEELVERFAEKCPDALDRDVYRAYFERICKSCGYEIKSTDSSLGSTEGGADDSRAI